MNVSFDGAGKEWDEAYMNLVNNAFERKALLDEYEALRNKLRRLLGMDDTADSTSVTVRKMNTNGKRACNKIVKRMDKIVFRLGELMIDENDMSDIQELF